MTKVSIIVPVYNVEQYLEKCLNSLVNQTIKDFEIIIVNDGTKDSSQKIIDKYAKNYSFIKSYIKENGGLSSARNYGIKKATGEYLAFVDSDDYVTEDMYEKMYQKAKEKDFGEKEIRELERVVVLKVVDQKWMEDFDMVVCDLNYIYPDKKIKATSNIKEDTTNIKETMLNIYPAAWNKIIKRSIVKDIFFKEGIWFEDVEYIYRVLPKITSIGVVQEPFYQYLQREGSITKKVDKRIYNYIDNLNGLVSQ